MERLFSKGRLSDVLENHVGTVRTQVDDLPADRILRSNPEELRQYFLDKFHIDPPTLIEDAIYMDPPSEVDIDTRGHAGYDWERVRGFGPPTAKGVRMVVHVPYQGDKELFHWRPSTCQLNFPAVEIRNDELLLVYDVLPGSEEPLKREYETAIASIRQNLDCVRSDVTRSLAGLPAAVDAAIAARRQRLIQNDALVNKLGLPVRRPSDQTVAVVLPKVRRPSPAKLPAVSR